MTKGIVARLFTLALVLMALLLLAGSASAQIQLGQLGTASAHAMGLGTASGHAPPVEKIDLSTAGGVGLGLKNGVTNIRVSDNTGLSMVNGVNANLNFRGVDIEDLVLRGVAKAASRGYPTASNAIAPNFEAFLNGVDTVSLIPEPSTWVMTIMGASLLLSFQRFRKKKD